MRASAGPRLQRRYQGNGIRVASLKANGAVGVTPGDGAFTELAHRASRAKLTTLLGAGAALGAAAGAAAAMRSQPEDVISGEVSIDLLKKVELLTIRLRLHRF
jgi:hypothetical protein